MPSATKNSKRKPNKPRKDFPLYAHRNGQWAKKIKGKTWFFGTWEDPVAALQVFVDNGPRFMRGVLGSARLIVNDPVCVNPSAFASQWRPRFLWLVLSQQCAPVVCIWHGETH